MMMRLKVIETDAQHEEALVMLEKMIDSDPVSGSVKAENLEVLAVLIESYEDSHFPMDEPDPIEAIKFRMDQMELTNKDMIPYFGSKARVSEVLNGKRHLSLAMIRKLHKSLGVPAKILLAKSEVQHIEGDLDWKKFPKKQMFDNKYFPEFSLYKDFKDYAEESIKDFIESLKEPGICRALLRSSAHERSDKIMDRYALLAWSARVFQKAQKTPLGVEYSPNTINDEFLRELVKLSGFDSGPALAKEYLNRHGIHFIVEPHLDRTYLDGAAFKPSDGNPIIALTARYDRLDNFWFVLLHEVAHVKLHLNNEDDFFFDDIEGTLELGKKEEEADAMAVTSLIPLDVWENSDANTLQDSASVLELARELGIHSSIIVSRLQRQEKNYRLLNRSIGRGQGGVRKHFEEFAKN
jgi:HTH-type transcriptional regulator/antitoxin HigA